MIIGLLALLLPLVTLLIMFAWGLFLGLKRTRIRFICVAVSFVLSMIFAISIKHLHADTVLNFLNSSAIAGKSESLSVILGSEGLCETLLQFGGALISPWVFLIVFVLLCSISWIVCNLIFLISSMVRKNDPDLEEDEFRDDLYMDFYGDAEPLYEDRTKKKGIVRVAIYAVAQVLLTFFVILTPVVTTLDCVPAVLDAACEIGYVKKESQDANALKKDQIMGKLDEFNKSPLVVCYRALGGNAMCHELTAFEVEGQKYELHTELGYISDFVADIFKLNGLKIQNYTEAEIEVLRDIDAELHESVLLPVVAGDLIYIITDAWLDETGPRPILSMQKPKFEEDTTSMVAEPFDHILEAFHKDAHNIEALRADFDTVERTMEILIHSGVIASMNENQTNAMVELLNSGNTLEQLLAEFDKNPSFAPLSDDITKIGMRAMGSTLKIPSESGEAYNQFTGDLASKLSDMNSQGLTPEEQKTQLTATIRETYEQQAGEKLDLSDDVVGLYADVLVKEFEGKEEITAEDMQKFFDAYAGVKSDDSQSGDAA